MRTEPSHIEQHSYAEIERIAATILQESFTRGINPPVDIDLVAEKQPLIESIHFLPNLRDRFNVEAALVSKPNGKFDILLDENTHRSRANFSVAHEVGHIVLHAKLYSGCDTIDDSVELSKRINHCYHIIEREANYFAGAILIPRKTIFVDTEKTYKGIISGLAGDLDWQSVISLLSSALANRYGVSIETMQIRLDQLKISSRLQVAVSNKFDFISWD